MNRTSFTADGKVSRKDLRNGKWRNWETNKTQEDIVISAENVYKLNKHHSAEDTDGIGTQIDFKRDNSHDISSISSHNESPMKVSLDAQYL